MNAALDEQIERELLDIDDVEVFEDEFDLVENILSLKKSLLSSESLEDVAEPISTAEDPADLDIRDFIDYAYEVHTNDLISSEVVIPSLLLRSLSQSTLNNVPSRISSSDLIGKEDSLVIYELLDGILSCLEKKHFSLPQDKPSIRREVVLFNESIENDLTCVPVTIIDTAREDIVVDDVNFDMTDLIDYSFTLSTLSPPINSAVVPTTGIPAINGLDINSSEIYKPEECLITESSIDIENLNCEDEFGDIDELGDRLLRIHEESNKQRKVCSTVSGPQVHVM